MCPHASDQNGPMTVAQLWAKCLARITFVRRLTLPRCNLSNEAATKSCIFDSYSFECVKHEATPMIGVKTIAMSPEVILDKFVIVPISLLLLRFVGSNDRHL
jgi:hypothetical protein